MLLFCFVHGLLLCKFNLIQFGLLGSMLYLLHSILPKQKEDFSFEFRDIILNKDDQYGDLDGGAQMVFFCGSPPVRSHNPVVRDEQFTKQTKSIFSPLPVNSFGVGKSCARVDRASPICGSFSGNPKVRIEGFTCKKSDSRSAVPALA
ncbi:hypothetical protein IEQ34_003927 [Dendrobium chrysotoxum]|uniref:Uncharacterized protein n=1 Tax=Dendrobium chrysotoxum TaxID=161865 RepID=A0AAV7HF29_DENCH|nr:hypothetical protein IEQ34_003927 [Dendrobium chrysotoxum]